MGRAKAFAVLANEPSLAFVAVCFAIIFAAFCVVTGVMLDDNGANFGTAAGTPECEQTRSCLRATIHFARSRQWKKRLSAALQYLSLQSESTAQKIGPGLKGLYARKVW